MKKFLSTGAALKITCVGFAVGVLLRVIFMLYCFDSSTGFYTDGGLLATLCLLLALLCGGLAAVCCGFSKGSFGRYVHRKNLLLGLAGAITGISMLVCGVVQLRNLYRVGVFTYKQLTPAYTVQILFALATLLFALVQLASAPGFFSGGGMMRRFPVLSLTGVLWGALYVMMVYLSYGSSPLFTENFFVVICGAALLLALLYLSKTLLNLEPEKSSRRLFMSGTLAVVLIVTHALSNLYLRMLGEWYKGELPNSVQLATLVMALFLLTFMATYKHAAVIRENQLTEDESLSAEESGAGTRRKERSVTSHFRGD